MWFAVAFVGFIAMLVFLVLGIVSLFKRNGTAKKRFLWMGISFVAVIIALVNFGEGANASKSVDTEAKVDVESKKKEEATSKEKADMKAKAEADKKAKEEEAAKHPNWNVKDVNSGTNGNFSLAVKLLKVMGDISQQGTEVDAGDVFKAPWNYYGKPTKLSGTVVIVMDYPPGSNEAKTGYLSQVVFISNDETPVIVLSTVPSGSLKVGDSIHVVGYPIGLETVDNKLGGKTDELVLVSNQL